MDRKVFTVFYVLKDMHFPHRLLVPGSALLSLAPPSRKDTLMPTLTRHHFFSVHFANPTRWFDDEAGQYVTEPTHVQSFDSYGDAKHYALLIAAHTGQVTKVERDYWDECEHGLSASLCYGPGHYPQDGAY